VPDNKVATAALLQVACEMNARWLINDPKEKSPGTLGQLDMRSLAIFRRSATVRSVPLSKQKTNARRILRPARDEREFNQDEASALFHPEKRRRVQEAVRGAHG